MTTSRTITLNPAQVRAVLIGLGAADEERRADAVGVIADALTADAPQTSGGPMDSKFYADLRRTLRTALGRWHADDREVTDAALIEYVQDAVRAADKLGRVPAGEGGPWEGGPWTQHGHEIPGVTVAGPGRPSVARCGGPAMCGQCATDAGLLRERAADEQGAD